MAPVADAGAAVMSLMPYQKPPGPGGADAKNTNIIKRQPGTIAGVIVPTRGGRLPLPRQYLPILWLAAG
jgi:hypothetical protein